MESYSTSLIKIDPIWAEVAVGEGVSVGGWVWVAVAVFVGVLVGPDAVGVAVATVPHGLSVDEVLRGLGVPEAKSRALSSVSVQPFAARESEVVLLMVGAGALPSKQFVPVP
jgi:hypothetical protein